jgi:uracil-DNA glycosylase
MLVMRMVRKLIAWKGWGCGCDSYAAELDARGPDWCEANLLAIVEHLREEATKQGLPFIDAVAGRLVRKAILRARLAETEYKNRIEKAAPCPPITCNT